MESTKAAGTSGEPKKENKMGVMPIPKLLLTMSLPMIISMIVQALYNVVDSIFVSQINENALTAVSLAFPIQNLMIAVASGTGVGVNALLSRSLGEKNYDQADKAANNSILLSLIGFAVFCLFGLFGSRIFFTMQTDDAQIIEYGVQYMTVICGLSIGIFMQVTLERLLQATGMTFYTMLTQGLGAILNIIFDPILIFGYFGFPKMGVTGAALATVFGQIVATLLAIFFNVARNHEIHIHPTRMRFDAPTIKGIYPDDVDRIGHDIRNEQDPARVLLHRSCGIRCVFQAAELLLHAGLRAEQRHGADHRIQLRCTQKGPYYPYDPFKLYLCVYHDDARTHRIPDHPG